MILLFTWAQINKIRDYNWKNRDQQWEINNVKGIDGKNPLWVCVNDVPVDVSAFPSDTTSPDSFIRMRDTDIPLESSFLGAKSKV